MEIVLVLLGFLIFAGMESCQKRQWAHEELMKRIELNCPEPIKSVTPPHRPEG